jgi:hypothetical protein
MKVSIITSTKNASFKNVLHTNYNLYEVNGLYFSENKNYFCYVIVECLLYSYFTA